MFGIGGQELILLMLIGLIVLGPEKLPRIAHQIGTWLGQARRMTRVMKRQLEEEIDFNQSTIMKPPPSAREPSHQAPPQDINDDSSAPSADEDKSSTAPAEDKKPVDEIEAPNRDDTSQADEPVDPIEDTAAAADVSTAQLESQKEKS